MSHPYEYTPTPANRTFCEVLIPPVLDQRALRQRLDRLKECAGEYECEAEDVWKLMRPADAQYWWRLPKCWRFQVKRTLGGWVLRIWSPPSGKQAQVLLTDNTVYLTRTQDTDMAYRLLRILGLDETLDIPYARWGWTDGKVDLRTYTAVRRWRRGLSERIRKQYLLTSAPWRWGARRQYGYDANLNLTFDLQARKMAMVHGFLSTRDLSKKRQKANRTLTRAERDVILATVGINAYSLSQALPKFPETAEILGIPEEDRAYTYNLLARRYTESTRGSFKFVLTV